MQLKGRLTLKESYLQNNLYICSPDPKELAWYVYPHDELFSTVDAEKSIATTPSWKDTQQYSYPTLSAEMKEWLKLYRVHALSTSGLAD